MTVNPITTAAAASSLNAAYTNTANSATAGASTSSTAAPNTAAASQQTFANDMNSFLKLLTTQLKNQDPTSPMDTTTFTNQLVMFAGVQQQIDTNSNLETLINLNKTSQFSTAVSYIGDSVEANSDQMPLQNGQAQASYTLDNNAASCTVAVTDSTGNVVYGTTGATTAGKHEFSWNGKDMNGNQLPDGTYTISVTPMAVTGGPAVNATTSVTGTVTGVETKNNTLMLDMGSSSVSMDNVLSVKGAGATTTASTTPTSNGTTTN